MFCRNCTDEGMAHANCFLHVNLSVIIIPCISFFGTLAFTLDIRKTIMLTFGSLTFGTLIQVQFGKILLQSTH